MIRAWWRSVAWQICLVFAGGALLGCGGGGTEPNPPGGPTPNSIVIAAGNGQTARVGSAVVVAPSVLVRGVTGAGVAGVTVTFEAGSGGNVTGAVTTTDTEGRATVGGWTLAEVGPRELKATVAGLTPVTFAATARLPRRTVAVYMAADNDLAAAGVQDIDEMEAAPLDPEVQVVVQAEFNQAALAQFGCASAACFNRPDYQTFQYQLAGQGGGGTGA